VEQFKAHYRAHRENHRRGLGAGFGDLTIEPEYKGPVAETAEELSDAELEQALETYWARGGARFMGAVADSLINEETNRLFADFVRRKIRGTVRDPEVAEALCPTDHPIGTKRICVDSGYYETYNRDNVSLVDLRKTPVERITAGGLQTTQQHYGLDCLVLATGFDAMTGALLRMDIRGVGGKRLAEKWAAGPRSYLGIGISGFPNLFTITGPGSPSVLSNMLVSIEQHVDWMIDCIRHMRKEGLALVEPDPVAENAWVDHVNEVAHGTLFPKGGSWYLGANVAGKPRVFMPYAAGVGVYREICDRVAENDYEGFRFSA
jgi:cyclohexanone monooxygenase